MSTIIYRYVFARSSVGNALSYMLADDFDGLMPASDWQKSFMRVYDGSLGPYEE